MADGGIWDEIKDWGKAAIPFLGAGLDFLGGILGNSANAEEAARNRRFVAQMYKKRYQFTVEDMRKAGLNPILAANGGNVGSISSTPTASFDNPFHGAINSAVSAANAVEDVQNKVAQRGLTESQTDLNQGKKVEQDIRNKELPKTVRAQAFRAEAEASLANSASVIERARTEFADRLAQYEAYDRWYKAGKSKWDFANSQYKFRSSLPMDLARSLRYQEWKARIRSLDAAPWFRGISSAAGILKAFH